MGREVGLPNSSRRQNKGTKYNTSTRADITNEIVLKTRKKCGTIKETAELLGCSYALVRSVLDGSRACPKTGLKIHQKDILIVKKRKKKTPVRICARCGEKKVRPPNRMLCRSCYKVAGNAGLAVTQIHNIRQ